MDNLREWLEHRKTDDKSVLSFFIKGYLFLSLLCFILLILPISNTGGIELVDHIFYSISIVSTTGLAPGNFGADYTLFGHIVSLFFIQLGGIGYMALSSFLVLRHFSKLPTLSVRLLKLEFNLPTKYPLRSFIISVFAFTFLLELLGTILLYIGFVRVGVDQPLWFAIFHSISAFCTAGFSLSADSMVAFRSDWLISTTIMVLSLLGSIGFIVLFDFWLRITQKRKTISQTAVIILVTTFGVWMLGSLLIFFSDLELLKQGWSGLYYATFQSISSHTTVGFNNYDISKISVGGLFIMIIIMIIGASPAGTGGGIKTTSIGALIAVLVSVLRRKKHITLLKKEIPKTNIFLAISSITFYVLILCVGVWIITLNDGGTLPFIGILFECSSALSTVGLSTGLTGEFSDLGKIIISLLMFIGRLGVLTFGLALISQEPKSVYKPKIEEIAI
jgi:trk system potassium uptake protein TrkH